ncbi:Cytosol aminopeptidase [Pontiella desulfatans]|uniref:Probable cytosol aminopeptidase n=1 Tax=Pontiella desulfatans TaxID=2750659 RepID=A0A6C2U2M9_PONDE|nr:leucyl aminopeptidase family protein [Pontiella desulfatans]VGO14248.1 Cytosol aminopeptidase [Pontiella desulfatans]
MKFSISPAPLAEQKKEALVVFCQGGEILLPSGSAGLRKQLAALLKNSAFKGEPGQVAQLPLNGKQVLLTGIGAAKYFHNGLLEQAAAAAIKAGRAAGLKTFAMASTLTLEGVSETDYQLLAGRGAAWGTYEYATFKTSAKKSAAATLTFAGPVEDRGVIKDAEAQGAALVGTADLANMPGNKATPTAIADWAKTMAKENGLTCKVMGETELAKKGCGGILSVASGGAEEARMIILKHKGTDPKAKPIVLVGKTLTFDSGGISLKPGKGMEWMRYDKSGGMAVLTAMQMIARMNVEVPVVGILCAAENMPGSKATRPGDIVTAYKGKTVEVCNTDAEGRLALMDALGLAVDMKPRAIVDIATLTGAVIMALGGSAAAVLGNQPQIVNELIDAGLTAGERLWQLPIFKDYSDNMKSDFADLSNISKTPGAGTATAAAFLQEFVPEDIPWAHIDIAGTAWLESPKPHQAPGATLFGARTLAQWVASQD